MPSEPTNYIRRALEAVGLEVDVLELEHYAPEVFGNLVAMAQTNVGELKIIYDQASILRHVNRIASLASKLG